MPGDPSDWDKFRNAKLMRDSLRYKYDTALYEIIAYHDTLMRKARISEFVYKQRYEGMSVIYKENGDTFFTAHHKNGLLDGFVKIYEDNKIIKKSLLINDTRIYEITYDQSGKIIDSIESKK